MYTIFKQIVINTQGYTYMNCQGKWERLLRFSIHGSADASSAKVSPLHARNGCKTLIAIFCKRLFQNLQIAGRKTLISLHYSMYS